MPLESDPSVNTCAISVVMPVYNGENFVERAVNSALVQGIDDCEILIINDGSTDGTAAKLAAYRDDPRVKILEHPSSQNRGASASRKLALEQAGGEFVAFLDADDEYLPGKLDRHISYLRENPQVLLIHGPVKLCTDDKEQSWTFDLGPKALTYELRKTRYFLRRNYICNSTVICRRSALRPQEDAPPVTIGGGEDWVLWNCVSFRGLLHYDPVPLTTYSDHVGSFTHRLLRKPGAVQLTAIEFYLCILPRLPRWSMRLRAILLLIYHLTALADLRRGPLKRGLVARCLHRGIALADRFFD